MSYKKKIFINEVYFNVPEPPHSRTELMLDILKSSIHFYLIEKVSEQKNIYCWHCKAKFTKWLDSFTSNTLEAKLPLKIYPSIFLTQSSLTAQCYTYLLRSKPPLQWNLFPGNHVHTVDSMLSSILNFKFSVIFLEVCSNLCHKFFNSESAILWTEVPEWEKRR